MVDKKINVKKKVLVEKKNFGYELLLDLYGCNLRTLNSKRAIAKYMREVVKKINMVAVGKPIIPDAFGKGDLHGLSGMQFIETSSIVVHAYPTHCQVHIDIFSCKPFNPKTAVRFSKVFFNAKDLRERFLDR